MIKDDKQAYSIIRIYRFISLISFLAWVFAIAFIYDKNIYYGIESDIPYLLIPIIIGTLTVLFWENIAGKRLTGLVKTFKPWIRIVILLHTYVPLLLYFPLKHELISVEIFAISLLVMFGLTFILTFLVQHLND
jgi:hypothetical protein